MTFMGLEARKDLPKVKRLKIFKTMRIDVLKQVTYPTALDYFVFISFIYIFSTVVQVWIIIMGDK